MIRDVVGIVRRTPVAADRDAVLVVAGGGGANPQRAVFLEDEAGLPQTLDPALDRAGIVQRLFGLPEVELDAEAARDPLLFADDLLEREARDRRDLVVARLCRSRPRRLDPPLATRIAQRFGDGDHVVARVAVLGQRKVGEKRILLREEMLVAHVDGAAERIDLRAGIVDDPFSEHVGTRVPQRSRQRIADRERAALHHDERTGRVRAAELERDTFAGRCTAPERRAGL